MFQLVLERLIFYHIIHVVTCEVTCRMFSVDVCWKWTSHKSTTSLFAKIIQLMLKKILRMCDDVSFLNHATRLITKNSWLEIGVFCALNIKFSILEVML